MGSGKVEKPRKVLRAVKTLVFLITMLASLLILSAPIILVIADTLLPSALLSISLPLSSLSLGTLSSHLKNYDFRYSLIDIPLISIIRSIVIFCVYCLCDGPRLSRGPYLWIATLCSLLSLVFVSMKAPYVFGANAGVTEFALFLSSIVLAVGHIAVAYRISCKERRKLLIYKIDIEAKKTKCLNFKGQVGIRASNTQDLLAFMRVGPLHVGVEAIDIESFLACGIPNLPQTCTTSSSEVKGFACELLIHFHQSALWLHQQ